MESAKKHPSERQTAIDAFLKAGSSICPFAKIAANRSEIFYLEPGAGSLREDIFQGVQDFLISRKPVFIVTAPSDSPNKQNGERQAHDLFIELAIAFGRIVNPGESEEAVRKEFGGLFRTRLRPDSELNPMIMLPPDKGLFTIAMNPAYLPTDPRYAPHDILVLTWMQDVKAAARARPDLVGEIHGEMQRRTGTVYDADVVWRK